MIRAVVGSPYGKKVRVYSFPTVGGCHALGISSLIMVSTIFPSTKAVALAACGHQRSRNKKQYCVGAGHEDNNYLEHLLY